MDRPKPGISSSLVLIIVMLLLLHLQLELFSVGDLYVYTVSSCLTSASISVSFSGPSSSKRYWNPEFRPQLCARAHTERLGNLCDYASPGLTSFLNSTANCSTSPLEYLISILTSTKTKFLIFALTWSSPSHLSPNWTNPLLSVLDCQSQPMPCSSANPLDYPWNLYHGLNSLPINFDLFQAIRI